MSNGDPSSLRYAGASMDRVTVLPRSLVKPVAEQIERAREVWQGDRAARLRDSAFASRTGALTSRNGMSDIAHRCPDIA